MKFIKRGHIWRLSALLLAEGVLFGTTDPTKVPSFMVIVGFGLLSLTFYYVIHGLIGLSELYGLSIKRKRSLSLYLVGALSAVLALQSIGELGTRDIWVLLPLVILGYFYSAYAKTSGRDLGG